MPMMYLLQFLIPLHQDADLVLQILRLLDHDNLLCFQIDLLLEKFLVINQILLYVDATAIVECGLPLLE
jgi:hypothetical protein